MNGNLIARWPRAPVVAILALLAAGCGGDTDARSTAVRASSQEGGTVRAASAAGSLQMDEETLTILEVRRCNPSGTHPDDRELIASGERFTLFLYDTHRGGGVRTVELSFQHRDGLHLGGSATRNPDGRWRGYDDAPLPAPPIADEGDRTVVTLPLADIRDPSAAADARLEIQVPPAAEDC